MDLQPVHSRHPIFNLPLELALTIFEYIDLHTKASILDNGLFPRVWAGGVKGLESQDDDGNTLLHIAAKHNYVKATQFLLSAGASPSTKSGRTADKSHRAPLAIAAELGHVAIAQRLLDHGACSNDCDGRMYPLHHAAENGHTHVVQLLLDHGAEQILSQDGTPVFLAAGNGHAEIVEILAARGADLTRKGMGVDALQIAVRNCHVEAVRALLKAGALAAEGTIAEDSLLAPPVMLAAGGPDFSTACNLAAYQKTRDQSPRWNWSPGEKKSYAEMLQLLFQHGADPCAEFAAVTALHLATFVGNELAVKVLLDSGACVHSKTWEGMTAAGFARAGYNPRITGMVLEAERRQTY